MNYIKKLASFFIVFPFILSASCGVSEHGTESGGIDVSNDEPAISVGDILEVPSEEIDDKPDLGVPHEDEPPPEPEQLIVRAVAVGDNLIHQPIYSQANRRMNNAENSYDFSPAYENVFELIAGRELAIINQETLICNDIFPPSSWPSFNSPVALGDFMIEMGFNVFGIANNHTLDKGAEGLSACLDYWRTKDDVVVVGAYYDKEDRKNIRTKEINGITFSFLSYTEHLNGLVLPAGSPLEIGDAKDLDTLEIEIARAKGISDVCVVLLHWGQEDYDKIEPYQRAAAKRMADAGADIILGTHPHVLRDIEYIERVDGGISLVAYSLANFISAQDKPQTMIGGVLSFEVAVNSQTREAQIKDVLLTPTITHYDSKYGFIRIYPLSEYTPELAAAHGVKEFGHFSYDYIYEVLNNNVSEEFLVLN
ncbi:MAG: CapA family protein [Oscillospiraceae bacterium]|nr:CapA family protein [Oscillospiraceae bacterium]